MSRWIACLALFALACVERPFYRPPMHPLYVPASDDRARPHRITFDQNGSGEAKGHARRAGTWWYLVDPMRLRGGQFAFSANYDGPPGLMTFALVDDRGEHVASRSDTDPNKFRIELRTAADSTATFLLRITTTAPVKFRVFATRRATEDLDR